MKSIRQTIVEAFETIRRPGSLADVRNKINFYRLPFGYDAFVPNFLPRSQRQILPDCTVISGWPFEWEQRYQTRGLIHLDPVLSHLKGVIDPFFWDEAATGRAEGRIVMDEARVSRLRQGFYIPIHQQYGSEACSSFGGPRLERSADEQAALHLIAIDAASTAKAIMHRYPQAEPDTRTRGNLTARDVDCLNRSAAGKTAWDIYVGLSLSRRTGEDPRQRRHQITCVRPNPLCSRGHRKKKPTTRSHLRESGLPTLMNAAGPSSPPASMRKHEAVRDAVRRARAMTRSLPVPVRPVASIGQGAQP